MIENKKILLMANTTFAVYNFRYGLMKELERQGYQIVVVAPKDIHSEDIKKNGWKYIELKMDRRGTNPLKDLKLIYDYYKILKKEKPKVSLQFTIKPNIYGNIAANFLKVPTINNITGLGDIFDSNGIKNRIVKNMYKLSFKSAKKVFFQNDDDLNIFLNNKLIKFEKCKRVPGSGVNIEKFKIMNQAKENKQFKFLFLGRINENKGVRLIYKASKKLKEKYPNVEFQLLGKVYKEEQAHISKDEMKIWEKESNIKYLGTSKDVRNEIKKCNCILFPSYYREGVPRSLIEAAAMGKPIITTDNVGCRDVVKNEYNGFLAKPKDLNSLIEKIEKVLSMNENELLQLGINGRLKVEKEFDEKIVIQKYIKEIKKLKRGANEE